MSEAVNPQTTPPQTESAAPRQPDAVPKDAAAVILLRAPAASAEGADARRAPEVFWARRGERLAFLGGFYAFPGGQRDALDAAVEVEHATDAETAAMMT